MRVTNSVLTSANRRRPNVASDNVLSNNYRKGYVMSCVNKVFTYLLTYTIDQTTDQTTARKSTGTHWVFPTSPMRSSPTLHIGPNDSKATGTIKVVSIREMDLYFHILRSAAASAAAPDSCRYRTY